MVADILIIDDEADIRNTLCHLLEDEGYTTRSAKNSDEALKEVIEKKPKLVVLDVWLNNSTLDGIEILEELKSMYKDLPVIIISGHGTVDMAVTATKKGAYDFLSKPFKTEALLNTIDRALAAERLIFENKVLHDKVGAGDCNLIGECSEIKAIRKKIDILSKSKAPVLIFGASGTGKDVVASLLHEKSPQNGLFSAFNAINTNDTVNEVLFGTLNPRRSGLLEEASSGTIAISNVELLSDSIQMQLSNVIGTGKITPVGGNKNLPLSANVVFLCRDDSKIEKNLYTRLKGNVIKMPTLSDRMSDIEEIANSFMNYRSKAKGASPLKFDKSAFVAFSAHDWQGNMWEFVNLIDRLLLANIKGVVKSEHVKALLIGNENEESLSFDEIIMQNMRDARADFEKYYLSYHLQRFDGNVTQTSEFVGMDRAALSRKLKTLGLS